MPFQFKIFNWFFSFILLASISTFAQQANNEELNQRLKKSEVLLEKGKSKKEKIPFDRDLKFGWDISNLLVGSVSPKRSGLDFSVDYALKRNVYGTVEAGINSFEQSSEVMDYFSDGQYFRIGFDTDMRKNKKDLSRDMFYLGARYGFSSFSQRIENYQITSIYWPTLFGEELTLKNQAHWLEAISGFKVEVFRNMYLGLGLRFKFLLYQADKIIKPSPFIPGYGKTNGALVVGFNYSVYYNLPLNYSKKKSKNANFN
jgi:hypothetical protein